MLELIIGLLFALQGGTICDAGTPVDWYDWVDSHPNAEIVAEVRVHEQWEFWLLDGDQNYDTGLVLFVFDMDNYPHGECARLVHLE